MLALTGYTDRISAEPGGTIGFKVSSRLDRPYRADLVRIAGGDPNPAGPGMKLEEMPAEFAGDYPSRDQPVHPGSYARITHQPPLEFKGSVTLTALVWSRRPGASDEGVIAKMDGAGHGLALLATAEGAALVLGAGHSRPPHRLAVGRPLAPHRWYRVWAAYDPASGAGLVGQRPLASPHLDQDAGTARASLGERLMITNAAPLLIGALGGTEIRGHFNGKIEDPEVLAAALEDVGADGGAARGAPVIAAWDFSRGIDTTTIYDAGPYGLHGELVNLPTRAVKGARWTGREMCWRHAPREYAAIHFHADDLYDCGWETDFVFHVPEEFRSGIYGARLRCGDAEDVIPFYVRPPLREPRAPILFLAPTFTYQAYANHARGNYDDAYRERAKIWGAYPHNPDAHPEYGRSTYNFHPDGSGVSLSSRLRPVLTMRPGFLTFVDAHGSGLRHFPADTHLTGWLEATGFAYDVATDEDLDELGVDLLRPYRTVLTGSHPEYHTEGTLDALQGYVDDGGRLVYLGGNGFYWRIARSMTTPGVIEVRRNEGGIRAWAAEPGEYYHALDGAYGGLWRRNDRPPQRLAGVGFSAQGLFEGSGYRRLPDAADPRIAWAFEGIDDELIGDFGLSGGGAAGFELDRADVRLGTPAHTLILARSEGHGPSFVVVPEELLSHIATWSGERPQDLIRAEVVYFETPKGGAVFSVGSITFCGSLPHDSYRNNVSRLLENVVRRFSN
jgi:N,N-dimethylformamidase